MLIPAYRPLLKLAKPVQKQIKVWPDDATSTLQDCFQCADWNMFREAATYNNHTDLHEYAETVPAYIKKCIDDVTVTKTITTCANQKPWMTAEVRGLLKTRDDAFRSGDKAALKTARANLSRGIKQAKCLYAQKINNHFTDSKDTRSLWQAIQTITDYKPPPQALSDALNEFYARFEMQNDTPAQKLPTLPNNQALCLSPADVRKTLSRVNTLDPLQFAYRTNRSTDNVISSTLHLALTHLENKDFYVRMLPQSVRVGHKNLEHYHTEHSPLLFTLLTHDCTAKFSSSHIIKLADDTMVVGLISNNDETPYREEVAQLVERCGANNLSLNVNKTKEVVMDFRRNSVDHPPLTIDSSAVERVSSTKFLGVHITEDLTWTTNTMSLSKKAQQRLHFLRRLKRASLPPPILTTFYTGTIESVLTSCITVWYGNCSAADRKTLQRTVNTAAKIIGTPLPSLLDIFLARCSGKTTSIVKDPTHPSHHLLQLLPSGRCYRSIRARSARLLNKLFPPGCESPQFQPPHPPLKSLSTM
ncbi:hypothetical protein M9458_036337 [Cirrhinus mrigala]|uniref:Alkylated DNA repair protein AlkB homologue 8 N-terminal domain-containing protein n=1 Tax=Cirrhinus mrigala TaxID=683832 RepID=A0ABD0P3E3_CIRMR